MGREAGRFEGQAAEFEQPADAGLGRCNQAFVVQGMDAARQSLLPHRHQIPVGPVETGQRVQAVGVAVGPAQRVLENRQAGIQRIAVAVHDAAAGQQLRQQPEWTASLQASYDWILPGGSVLTPLLQMAYSDDYYSFDVNVDGALQEAYTIYDARLIWTTADARVEVQGYVLNIGDEEVMTRSAIFNH